LKFDPYRRAEIYNDVDNRPSSFEQIAHQCFIQIEALTNELEIDTRQGLNIEGKSRSVSISKPEQTPSVSSSIPIEDIFATKKISQFSKFLNPFDGNDNRSQPSLSQRRKITQQESIRMYDSTGNVPDLLRGTTGPQFSSSFTPTPMKKADSRNFISLNIVRIIENSWFGRHLLTRSVGRDVQRIFKSFQLQIWAIEGKNIYEFYST